MRIFKVSDAYSEYIDNVYADNVNLRFKTFYEQQKFFFDDAFPDMSWTPNIADSNVEIFETILNCEYLQKSWKPTIDFGGNWQLEILIDQIKDFKPDVCYLSPTYYFTCSMIDYIKQETRLKFIVLGYDGVLRQNLDDFKGYDLILTCSRFISEFYDNADLKTYTLEFGFDESILSRIKKTEKIRNVCFSGSLYNGIHNSRSNLIKYLLSKNVDIDVFTQPNPLISATLFKRRNISRILNNHDLLDFISDYRIALKRKEPVFGINMFETYAESKISINMHGDKIDFAANVRLFEITGVGSCMLTDWKKNIEEIFIPDKEIVTFCSKEEAHDKIKYLLKNEKVREKIAIAGQQRTLNEYTLKKRMAGFIQYLQKNFF